MKKIMLKNIIGELSCPNLTFKFNLSNIYSIMDQTQFTLEYIVSVSTALLSAYIMQRGSPDAPAFIKFLLIPMLVAYITLKIVNTLFPKMNEIGRILQNYTDNRVLGGINNTNYLQIFPPILLVFVMTLAVLFLYS